MRQFSQEGKLNGEIIQSILQEEKPNQKEQFRGRRHRKSKTQSSRRWIFTANDRGKRKDNYFLLNRLGNNLESILPIGISKKYFATTLIPEKTGLIYLKNIFLIWIKRVQLNIKSSKRIIAILKFASIDFSIAKGFDEKSFIKKARASFVSI